MYDRFVAGLSVLTLASCATSEPQEALQASATTMGEWAQGCEQWDDWDKPAPPFKIYGNTFYVGTCGISVILVIGDDSHILIDSGTEAGAKVVLANVEELALSPESIDFLLHSHEHFDHVGGHAIIEDATNAQVVASTESSAVLAGGLDHPEDPQFGMHDPIAPVRVSAVLRHGDAVQAGPLRVEAIKTPGHSPGALSWQWESCEDDKCLSIVYADSLSPVSSETYQFSDHPQYVVEYRAGLQRLREMKCDILLTPHPSASKMVERAKTSSLKDGMSCIEYADNIEKRLDKRLLDETTEVASD